MDVDVDEDGPVVCEFDVYINNATLGDILDGLIDPPTQLSVAKELSRKAFDGILLLQYPLELANPENSDSSSASLSFSSCPCSNATDKLDLKSLLICKDLKKVEYNKKGIYRGNPITKDSRRSESPLLCFVYGFGYDYLYREPVVPKKISKVIGTSAKRQISEVVGSVNFMSPITGLKNEDGRGLELKSAAVTNEHVMDCLGILDVEETPEGLKRSLHIIPAKGILQMRPNFKIHLGEVGVDDYTIGLFQDNNIRWKEVGKIFEADSSESNEFVEKLLLYGKLPESSDKSAMKFKGDMELYANSVCFPDSPNHDISKETCNAEYDLDGFHHTLRTNAAFSDENWKNNSHYAHKYQLIPNTKFMGTLDVKMQLMLLLSQRHIESFYSLKNDLICVNVDENEIIETLKSFAGNIDGNWVISSEYAIPNYTEEDECDPDEREYLICCRDLMLALLSRQTCQPHVLRVNTSVGHLASEPFQNATGLPLNIVNKFFSSVASLQGKFWSLKLEKDEKFCTQYPKIVQFYQKYWANRLIEAANTIQNYKNKTDFTVGHMVENIIMKSLIVDFMRNRTHSTGEIRDHLRSLGCELKTHESQRNLENILKQVALPIERSEEQIWILKKDDLSLKKLQQAISNDSLPNVDIPSQANDDPTIPKRRIPDFISRRIDKAHSLTLYGMLHA